MGYSAEIYTKALSIVDRRRADAKAVAAEHRREVYAKIPQMQALDAEISRAAADAAKAIGMQGDAQKYVQSLSERNLAAQEKRRVLLRENGYPEDYLKEKHTCSLCSDTGFCGGIRCKCVDDLMRRIAYSSLCSDFPVERSTFESFNLGFYSKRADPKTGVVPYTRMEEVLNYCKQYAADFDMHSPSLFMYGETGLGKTHLSLAIAGAVTKKGFGVIYGSAQNLLDRIEREHFKGEDEGANDAILGCDLLILDDLGAEFSTQFSVSAVYNILNTRLMSGKPVIISTNLTIKELEKRYTRRITSRIFGTYTTLAFVGSDVRQLLR